MLRDLARRRQEEDKRAHDVRNTVILAFVDNFGTRTTFSSLLHSRHLQQSSGRAVPRVVVYAPTVLSMWISDKANLAACLTRPGFCPETIVYNASRDETSVYKMRDETALMHVSKRAKTRWYAKPVGQSEGRGIRVIREATMGDVVDDLRSHALAANGRTQRGTARDYVCQREITPPLLTRTKAGMCKFDVRFYAVVDTRGQCLIYPDARVRCANSPYDVRNTDAVSNVCNTTLQSKLMGLSTRDLVGPKLLSQLDNGATLIRDAVALIQRAVQHVVTSSRASRAIQRVHEHAAKHDIVVYSALGVDIGFDAQGRPWIIEINKRPMVLNEEYYHRAMAHYLEVMLANDEVQ